MGRFDRSTTPRAAGDAANGAHTIVRAQRLAASGNVAQALVLFRDIVREGNPRDRQAACVGAGNAYLAMQRYELAEACYEQAAGAGSDPDLFAESLQNLGIPLDQYGPFLVPKIESTQRALMALSEAIAA